MGQLGPQLLDTDHRQKTCAAAKPWGSLPNDVFADVLGLPTLWVPHSYPACSQHAPNEHLLAPVVKESLQIMAGLFWDLGNDAARLTQEHQLREQAQ